MERVGVSILTNGARLESLQTCLSSLLSTCHFRPLTIAVFNNGSTDKTHEWCLEHMRGGYGINWLYDCSEEDLGCAKGSNRAAEMVKDCKYVLHLECDFRALPESLSGCDRHWLHRALDFMDTGDCEYLYLRRMLSEYDIGQHWWSRWADKMGRIEDDYMECNGFWWSNNPHLRLNKSAYERGCLPLDESEDGPKGTPNWSKPERIAGKPNKTWIHRWGIFVHEAPPNEKLAEMPGCLPGGGCKYGFFKSESMDLFCRCCNLQLGYDDMHPHFERFKERCTQTN
jgi:glycosyltransferase involved in cell wall biosynthesis